MAKIIRRAIPVGEIDEFITPAPPPCTWPKGIYGDVIGDQPVKSRHLSNAHTFVCSSMATKVKRLRRFLF